ncbi:uncharacterized protein BO66DRAFT_188087 [Aspergillus aculeatinus CBS 121060]|uniref:Uncharacterized protein n=1 Tax=Aspergillus aculeatinus CBS 121060 TaxID=1448322 RepID=A0ACD1GY78_9EURO|nr:hypothetical protein BO66DRAFT_188087 [Aspergillus aculeatinus CBS 121060]RAH66300.1 hypothetical protein BO66DRAFT_188087 [Aspergillus aculeatinus CBS 121060]
MRERPAAARAPYLPNPNCCPDKGKLSTSWDLASLSAQKKNTRALSTRQCIPRARVQIPPPLFGCIVTSVSRNSRTRLQLYYSPSERTDHSRSRSLFLSQSQVGLEFAVILRKKDMQRILQPSILQRCRRKSKCPFHRGWIRGWGRDNCRIVQYSTPIEDL